MANNKTTELRISVGRERVALNSTAVQNNDFVIYSGGFVTVASAATEIIGVSMQTKTYTSDNQTVAKAVLAYVAKSPEQLFRVAISGGTITAADEGKFYSLTDARTVDGTTEATSPYDTNGALVKNVQLIKFVTATSCDFKIV